MNARLILGLVCALGAAPLSEAQAFIPPDDKDVLEIREMARQTRILGERDYCAAIALRPRVAVVADYMTHMQAWLALARKDGIAQLKNIMASEVRDSNRAADLQMIISMQEALLHFSEMLTSLTSMTEALSELRGRFDSEEYHDLAKLGPKKLAARVKEDLEKAKAAYDAVIGHTETLRGTLRKNPSPEAEILPQDKRELLARINKELPSHFSSLSDIVDLTKKLKEYASSAKELVDVAEYKATLVKWLTLVARWQQGKLLGELKEITASLVAVQASWSKNYIDYKRLRARADIIYEALDYLRAIEYDPTPCHQRCVDAPAPPAKLALGGLAFDGSGRTRYSQALPQFGPATTAKYAALLSEIVKPKFQALLSEMRKENPPAVTFDREAKRPEVMPWYAGGEEVKYQVRVGPSCHGAVVDVLHQYIERATYPPFFQDVAGTFKPDRSGRWTFIVTRDRGLSFGSADFLVTIDRCLLGKWRSREVQLKHNANLRGGAGIVMTIQEDGRFAIDYEAMKPLEWRYVSADGRTSGSQTQQFRGSAEGHISTAAGKAKHETTRRTDVLQITSLDGKYTTRVVGGIGPALLSAPDGSEQAYVCDDTTLKYENPFYSFIFAREKN